jgi:hypothetical protein
MSLTHRDNAVDVQCHDDVTASEHDEIEEWIRAADTHDVQTVVVGDHVVAVHGYRRKPLALSGTAERHGKLTIELTAALALMRRARE